METTEKIVESYCRYVEGWFTIPNIKCKKQYEIDLLAIDTSRPRIRRYHVECGISISGSYSKLTAKNFSVEELRQREKMAGQRRTIDYFIKRKFEAPEVLDRLAEYGFKDENYQRIIVTWGATEDARKKAEKHGILLWDFPDLLTKIADKHRQSRSYFTDDTARTIQLFDMALKNSTKAQ